MKKRAYVIYGAMGVLTSILRWGMWMLLDVVDIYEEYGILLIVLAEIVALVMQIQILWLVNKVKFDVFQKSNEEDSVSTEDELSNFEKANYYFKRQNYILTLFHLERAADEGDSRAVNLWKLVKQQMERKEGRR